MARFETSLDKWFKRKNVRMWITEYGHETKQDGEKLGVTRAKQAAYAAQALGLAKKDARVDMFVWFIFKDDATSLWQSGLITKTGAAKPALARFRNAARSADIRNPIVKVRGKIASPLVSVPLRDLATNNRAGTPIGFNIRVLLRGKTVAVSAGAGADRRSTRSRVSG